MDFSLKPPTLFAPAERKDNARLREESAAIASSEFAGAILNALVEPAAIINKERQVVYANQALLELAGVDDMEDLIGLRLGELLGCTHAVEDLSGCGTHPSCRTCGTVNGALEALAGEACTTEVALDVVNGQEEASLEFQLTATPIPCREKQFALLRIEPV